jgi:HTH-type transcriptional regulator/antitoxin HigA
VVITPEDPRGGSGQNAWVTFAEYGWVILGERRRDANYSLEGSTSDSRLRSLMEEHGLRQPDLLDVFGSRGIASEVVNGKRAISKAQAKKLAGLFHVPADLFF